MQVLTPTRSERETHVAGRDKIVCPARLIFLCSPRPSNPRLLAEPFLDDTHLRIRYLVYPMRHLYLEE